MFALAGAACGGDDTGDLEVSVSFETPMAEMNTATLHVWAVKEIVRTDPSMPSGSQDPQVTCARLVGGLSDPYDQNIERRADQVFFMPLAGPAVLEGLAGGNVLVYVEGVDQVGRIHLAGCVESAVPGRASVHLVTAGVFDCADSMTEDGSPCDDGSICTVDERCDGGSCVGGVPLNCSFVASACFGSNCAEGVGCVPVPLPNLEPCDDQLFCTDNDVCMDGICRGTPLDCALQLGTGPCELAFCDEAFDFCDENYVPASTACDDGRYCTTMSECNGFGTCFATENVVCPPPPDTQCNFTSTCNDTMMACVPNPRPNGTICSHPATPTCPVNDTCLGPGTGQFSVCTPPQRDFDLDGYIDARCTGNDCNDNNNTVFPGGTESTAAGTTCSDGLDNNCNGLFDCADVANCGGGGCGTGGCMCGILPACPCGTAACPVGGAGC